VTASASSVTAAETGTISITSTVTPPQVTRVTALSNPWRLQVDGSNFASGVKVYIGADSAAWTSVERVSAQRIVIGGGATLRSRFPHGVTVPIRIVNPDGGTTTTSYRR
jgi:hypothetical protein